MSKESFPKGVVLVGKKPTMNYALATMLQFSQGTKEVTLKARGSNISKAVDVVEIVRRRLFGGTESVKIKEIKTGSETVGEGNSIRTVSTIEIVLSKE